MPVKLFCLVCFGHLLSFVGYSAYAASPEDPRWHLQRIVQRKSLTTAQLITGTRSFNVSSIPVKPVTIYVVDSGMKIEHEDFAPARASYGINILSPDQPPSDCNGHGTHVGSLAGGLYSGVAITSKLISVRVLNCEGTGTCAAIVGALDWVLQHSRTQPGRSVAVLSVGSTSTACSSSARASQLLWDDGVVVVAAAGNLGADSCRFYPARNEATISVGATDIGDRLFKNSNVGACVDLFAPGVNVLAAWHERKRPWKDSSGTSMAAPLVVGVAALILGADDSMTPEDVREILKFSSTPNAVLSTDGSRTMNRALNQFLYAPWARLFDAIPVNKEPTSVQDQYMGMRQDVNATTEYLVLGVRLKPRITPAMAFSVIRIARAISSVIGVEAGSIVRRRAAGAKRLDDGSEPKEVDLLFYVPVSNELLDEYEKRLVNGGEDGSLMDRSKESLAFSGGSVRKALGRNSSLPEFERESDIEIQQTSSKQGMLMYGLIGGGIVVGLLVVVTIVIVRKSWGAPPMRSGDNDEADETDP